MVFFSKPCFAEKTFQINDDLTTYPLGEYFEIFEDKSAQLTIEDVSKVHFQERFVPMNNKTANLGFSNSVFWLKLNVHNNTNIDKWSLKNNYNSTQYLDLFEVNNNQVSKLLESGFLRPIDQRSYHSFQMILPITIPVNSQKTYYIRLETLSPVIINFNIKSQAFLKQSELSHNLFIGTFIGMMLILFAVNLLFYFILKIKSQLYLAIYIFSILTVYSLFDGLLLPLVPYALIPYSTIIMMMMGSCAVLFIYLYYEQLLLTKINKKLKYIIRYSFFFYWLIINILTTSTDTTLPYKMYFLSFFLVPFIGFIFSGYAWYKKQHHAKYIFIGLCFLCCSYFLQLGGLFVIPEQMQFISGEAGRVGILILSFMLSIAIVDFVRKIETKQLETTKQFKKAELKFSQIFEQAYQMLFILTPEGTISQINRPVQAFFNKQKTDIINQQFLTLFPTLRGNIDQEIMVERLKECLAGNITKQTISAFTSEKTLKELEISYQPFTEDNNTISNIIVRVQDITKQTQAFNAIQDMVVGIAGLSSEYFFKNVITEISRIYGAKFVMISLLNDGQPLTASSLVISKNKKLIPNITYAVKNSPSELLITQHLCNFPNQVNQHFPNDEWLTTHHIQAYLGVNIKNDNDEVIGFLSIMDDKTLNEDNYFIEVLDVFASRVAIELKQQQSQQSLKQALNKVDFHITNTPLGVIEWDTDFNVTNWNKAAERIFGFDIHDFSNRNPLEVLVPRNQINEVKRASDELIRNKSSQYNLNNNLTKDGRTILCEWYNTPLLNEDNEVLGVASLVSDVTAEHEALNALYVKEQEQTEIFNALIDAIFIVDYQGNILSVNNTATQLFNYKLNEFIGSNLLDLIQLNKDNSNDDLIFINQIFDTNEKDLMNTGKDLNAMKKDGSIFPIYLFISKLPADQSGNLRYICTCHDLTLFKQQQETLKQSQKMDALGNLTGGIAHDFNNILGIINGYSELLANNISTDSKLSNYAQHILKASARGAKLTQKLLSFASKNTFDSEKVNINKILIDEFEMLQKTITPRINLTYNLDENIPETHIDKAELEDCILNLVINAMHAITHHGEITITTQTVHIDKKQAKIHEIVIGEYISLAIKDNGIGMDDKTQQQALEPFFTTKGDSGTGLGLSQVYGFIERSKGLLTIESSLGNGCQITLLLPVYFNSSKKINNPKLPLPTNQADHTILVIDDEPALVELSTTILTQAGYTVIASNSAQKGLIELEKQQIDAIVCDVIMPNMDGLEFAQIVQQTHKDIPILFVSGYQGANLSGEQEELVSTALKKPFRAEELLHNLAELLQHKKLRV